MRLFSTKGKNLEDLDPAMFAKSKPGRAGKTRYFFFLVCQMKVDIDK